MADLPGLLPGDPENYLSFSARRRIREAFIEAERMRTRVLESIEARFESQPNKEGGFSTYIETGAAAREIRQSFMDSARLILTAKLREFRAAGKSGRDLQEIMDEEIESCVNSYGLTILQRDVLTQELDTREPQPEEAIPEIAEDQIRVGILRIHAKLLAGQKPIDCLLEAYDLYVTELLPGIEGAGKVLTEDIPVLLFRTAVQQKWIPYPLQRRLRIVGNLIEGWYTKQRYERVPQQELTETFGGYRVTPGYGEWFKNVIQARIAHWKAEVANGLLDAKVPKPKSLKPSAQPENPSLKDSGPSRPELQPSTRAAEVAMFLQECNKHSPVRLHKRHIWLSAGHSKGRQFEYWQACSLKATQEDERNFSRILRMKPEDFVALLEKKRLISEKE